MLVLLSLFASTRLLSAQDQPPRKTGKASELSLRRRMVHRSRKWLDEDVRWIITDQERAAFKELTTDEQRDDFIDAFWERRNPNPGSEENKFKEDHYARFVYANERFAGPIPGWKTDRGRIYILYGPPDEREQYPGRTDASSATDLSKQRFSTEVWRYNRLRQGVSFVFLDRCKCDEYVLQRAPAENSQTPTYRTTAPGETAFPTRWGKWLGEDVCYIITTQELADFYNLETDQERDKFVTDFWNRRNPNPGSQENKYKQEHYRRIAYANLHFAADIPGWKTDRGQIYILYGPPDSIDHHYSDTSLANIEGTVTGPRDWQVWHYRFLESTGRYTDFQFVDTCMCGRFERQEMFSVKMGAP